MAIGLDNTLRSTMATDIVTFAGSGALIRIYSGTRPAKGGTATTLLAQLTCAATLGTVSNGVLTLNAITQDSSADASGTPTWFRVVKSDGTTHVLDGEAAVGSGDLNLLAAITAGQPVQISSATITVGA